jgi:hypothetical protein
MIEYGYESLKATGTADKWGGFVAIDHARRLGVYADPGSLHAISAARDARGTAERMLAHPQPGWSEKYRERDYLRCKNLLATAE